MALGAGSGVHIFLLSSGVRATHKEFQATDGTGQGEGNSRIVSSWGYAGLNPLEVSTSQISCCFADHWLVMEIN